MKRKIIVSLLSLFVTAIFVLIICSQKHSINNLNEEINLRGIKIQEYESKETNIPEKTHTDKKKENSSSDSDKIDKLNKDISELEKENSKLKEKVSELETKQKVLNKKYSILEHENEALKKASSSTKTYLEIKFWYDGKNYEITNEDMKLYKNPFLSKEATEKIIVVSPTISPDSLDNGQTVYTVMSTIGLIYMSSYPNFSEIEGSHLRAPESAFSQEATDKYLAIKFWHGNYNKRLYENSNQSWYNDCSLQNSIENSESILIISENPDCFVMNNGVQVYTAMSQDKTILWMYDTPSLENID